VALHGISPLIWPRILVRSDCTVAELQATLQLFLGRSDDRLHRFMVHGREYSVSYAGGLSFSDDPALSRSPTPQPLPGRATRPARRDPRDERFAGLRGSRATCGATASVRDYVNGAIEPRDGHDQSSPASMTGRRLMDIPSRGNPAKHRATTSK
jgi:hypothetical protein